MGLKLGLVYNLIDLIYVFGDSLRVMYDKFYKAVALTVVTWFVELKNLLLLRREYVGAGDPIYLRRVVSCWSSMVYKNVFSCFI